jgi:four helix bundle protein
VADVGRTGFSHEKLDVYRLAIEYCKRVFLIVEQLAGKHRHARDQLLRAAQSIPLNIAEGNGRATDADRHHFFSIARGSAFECAALQDVLDACQAIQPEENQAGKNHLLRIVAMLTKMGGRGYSVNEEPMLLDQVD